MILTPLGVAYSSKQYLESTFKYSFKDEKESELEFSLLNLEGFDNPYRFEKLSAAEMMERIRGCRSEIRIDRDASADVGIDLLIYDLKTKLELISPGFFKTIKNWENSVRYKVSQLGKEMLPNVEIFVKVFTFVKQRYTTKYKKLAELFSLPLNLYIEFDKKFDPTQIEL